MWAPGLTLDPAATEARQDVVSIVLLLAVLAGPAAWGSGLLAGRATDERRRFAWLMGFGLLAALGSWLVATYAGDASACARPVAPRPGVVTCASTLAERITGLVAAQVLIWGQWIVARREWLYRPGREW